MSGVQIPPLRPSSNGILSPTTLAKMSKGKAVATPILEKICSTHNCDIGDIVSYVPEPPTSPKGHKRGKEDPS